MLLRMTHPYSSLNILQIGQGILLLVELNFKFGKENTLMGSLQKLNNENNGCNLKERLTLLYQRSLKLLWQWPLTSFRCMFHLIQGQAITK